MSWLPAFEIGLWNAWILMLYFPLHPLIMIVVDKAVGTGGIFKKMGDVPYEKGEKRAYVIYMVVLLVLLAYSVFLPLKLGTLWFYAGLTTYLVGLVIFLTAIVNIATTPLGQPFTNGMYRYSRHPLYFSFFFILCRGGFVLSLVVFLVTFSRNHNPAVYSGNF
jgi:protein-S-isoprenylcysteine O-methyltransferase Ste14